MCCICTGCLGVASEYTPRLCPKAVSNLVPLRIWCLFSLDSCGLVCPALHLAPLFASVQKHIRSVHLRKRPHVCDMCNAAFGEKNKLVKVRLTRPVSLFLLLAGPVEAARHSARVSWFASVGL